MITSTSKKIHHQTGIIEVLINTDEKWPSYQINRLYKKNKIVVSFYDSKNIEYMPGQWEEEEFETVEYIDMKEGFNALDYMVYHNQEKDKIDLMIVPRTLLLNHKEWKAYEVPKAM